MVSFACGSAMFGNSLVGETVIQEKLKRAGRGRVMISARADRARLRAELAADHKARSFEGCAYAGGIMFPTLIVGSDDNPEQITGPVVVDLDSIIIPSQNRPVLDNHDASAEVGRTRSIVVEGYELNVEGVVYPNKPGGMKILSASDGGHQWQLSLGMDGFIFESVPAQQYSRVNGQDFQGPITILRKARLIDISFVSVGADDTTWARIAAKRGRNYRLSDIGVHPRCLTMLVSARGGGRRLVIDELLTERKEREAAEIADLRRRLITQHG